MTTEHLKFLLKNVMCTELFGEAATRLASATRDRVRNHIGRMTALQTVECEALSWEMCFAGWSHTC